MQEERIHRLEASVEALARRIEALEQQLASGWKPAASDRSAAHPTSVAAEAREATAASGPSTLPLIGRTLLVLGGGFLFRAATESGVFPEAVGAFLGFLYGLSFLLLAFRAARRPEGAMSARFHGFGSSLIVFPLIWEATVQRGYLSVPGGGASLAAAVALALGVAWIRRLPLLAWIFSAAGAVMAFAMAWTTHWWFPLVTLALLISWATLLLFYSRGWALLAMAGAFFADVIVLLLGTLFLMQEESPFLTGLALSSLLGLQLLLVASYMGTFVYGTIVRGREIRPLESLQTVLVLAVGVGLALAMGREHPALARALGWMSLVGAGASYGISFAFIDRRAARRRNFIFYTSIAFALTLVMSVTLVTSDTRTWLLLGFSAVTAFLASRRHRVTLLLHATLFATAAAFSSGLLALSIDAYTGDVVHVGVKELIPSFALLVMLAVCASLQVRTHQDTWGPLVSAPRVICWILLVIGGSGALAALAESAIARGDQVDAAWVASIRTCMLSCFAMLMAWLALRPRYHEAWWLVYPVLVLAGFGLVFGDFRNGRPATMVVSFALYGGALILVPRWIRRARHAPPSDPVGA